MKESKVKALNSFRFMTKLATANLIVNINHSSHILQLFTFFLTLRCEISVQMQNDHHD
jgi:hypothetical protein